MYIYVGIYPSTLINVRVFSDCEAIVITAWALGQSLDGPSGYKNHQIFHFLRPLRRLNGLQWH